MKVSIVIISWNDREDILKCLESIYSNTSRISFEVIVTDNGSVDGTIAAIQERFPTVRLIENAANLGFAGGNNQGFRQAAGDYVLILNPDTIIHDGAIERLVEYAERHPEAGAFGCRVLNPDGSYQPSAYPLPSVGRYLVAALYLRGLTRLFMRLEADIYVGWEGESERAIGFQAGCCLLIRRNLLTKLRGFDERLFHQFEDADLCKRVWQSGYSVRFCPEAVITHIGGQNRGRYPAPVVIETHRSRYRFFFKHYGRNALRRVRWVTMLGVGVRFLGYGLLHVSSPKAALKNRLEMYRTLLRWHWRIDPVRFIQTGAEPDVGCRPLAPAPNMLAVSDGA